MSATTNQNESGSRWWEFYAVRYGMGTVVGAVIVFILCKHNATLAPMLFQAGAATDPKLESATLVLLAGYGLAYCYLASAPILVLHATRHQMFDTQPQKHRALRWLVLLLGSAFAGCVVSPPTSASENAQWLLRAAIFIGTLLILMQWLCVWQLLSKEGAKKNFDSYKQLAEKRDTEKTSIVDSYRHLREHGNSFLIVVFELLLAFVMFAVSHAYSHLAGLYLLTAVFLWVLPAAVIWCVGTQLEHLFANLTTASTTATTTAPPSNPTH
jgi:hypothetical protein